jgi:hypothetical protein
VSVPVEEALAVEVSVAGVRKPFGEFSDEDVVTQASALGEASGFGHRSRVGGVAAAWRELGRLMNDRGATQVDELDPETIDAYVERLWVVPPGGSLLP